MSQIDMRKHAVYLLQSLGYRVRDMDSPVMKFNGKLREAKRYSFPNQYCGGSNDFFTEAFDNSIKSYIRNIIERPHSQVFLLFQAGVMQEVDGELYTSFIRGAVVDYEQPMHVGNTTESSDTLYSDALQVMIAMQSFERREPTTVANEAVQCVKELRRICNRDQ